ncbi:flotillin domain-containing protein, partial [Acinetobacter baumannii]
EADRIAVAALAERYKVEADGKEKLNAAENLRSDASRRSALHQRLVENLPAIIRESVKPMEKIEGIKILHVEGLPGFSDA